MIFKLNNLHKFFFTHICPTFYGGPPAAPSNTTSTVNQNTIPAELMPYALGNLQAAKNQLFKTDASGQITGYQPYKPYSADANKYVAGFSALQKQAQQGAGKLAMPGQFGTATGMATEAGQGAMGAGESAMGVGEGAIGTGAQAARAGEGAIGIGARAYGAGDEYNQMATDPGSMAQWMSPYMQNVTDYQTQQANRQYDISGAQQAGGAARAGAFGGSRDAIMAAENERNRNQNITGIQATGAQSAWQDARAAQQFGANLGMQGYQTGIQGIQAGLQGYNTQMQGYDTALKGYQTGIQGYQTGIQGAQELGNLGTQQLAAQTDILNTKNQYGGEVQARNQALINQRIKNWENQQNQPYRAMDTMSGLIRGTPISTSATTTSVANPSYAQQIGSTVGAIGSMYGAYKGKANGGIVGYADGGSVEGSIEAQLNDMDDAHLQEIIQTSTSESIKGIAKRVLTERSIEGKAKGGITQAYANGGLSEEEIQRQEKETGIPYDPNDPNYIASLLTPEERAPLPQEKPQYTFKNAEEAKKAIDNPEAPESVKVAAANTLKGIVSGEELANREVRKGIEDAGLTTPVESNAAPEPEPQSPSGILSAYNKEYEASPQTQEDRATAAKSEQQLMEEEAAKQKASGLQTTQEATAEERKQIMEGRANAEDEKKRQMYLRMAEFFANWGSTPGAPLVAGLKAMKEVIPGVMEDTKAHRALIQDLNKSENDLNHAVRLEEMGKWDKASAVKDAASERLTKHAGTYADLGIKVAQQQEELAAAQKRTETSVEGSVQAAGIRSEGATNKPLTQRDILVAKGKAAHETAVDMREKEKDFRFKRLPPAEKEKIRRDIEKGYTEAYLNEAGFDTTLPEPTFTPPPADDPEAKQKVIDALRAKRSAAQKGG